MSDHFGFLFVFFAACLVMVAFDMEPEVTSSFDHFIISLFVLFELFKVGDVSSD